MKRRRGEGAGGNEKREKKRRESREVFFFRAEDGIRDYDVTGVQTCALPISYVGKGGYSNWELSTDRANASRRALTELGLPASRIVRVTGMAATEPLMPEDPTNPQNRRISVLILREGIAPVIKAP